MQIFGHIIASFLAITKKKNIKLWIYSVYLATKWEIYPETDPQS